MPRMRTALRGLAAAAAGALAATAVHAGSENISFPGDYKTTFHYWKTSERFDNNQVRYLWANDLAFDGAAMGADLPNGAQFVMEVYGAKVDADGEPILDADGQMMPDRIKVIAVMEKGEGWGDEYPADERNGDWEYGFFSPEGMLKPGVDTGPCRACHLPYADEDYVIFRADLDAAAAMR